MKKTKSIFSRRNFILTSVTGLAALPVMGHCFGAEKPRPRTRVVLVKTEERAAGIRAAIQQLGIPSPKGQKVLIKPNFNTADTFPGSTHNDTLAELVREMKRLGAGSITVGERSGPPPTQKVMEEKGIFTLAKELGFNVINFEELPEGEWVKFSPEKSNWPEGFSIPKPVTRAEYIVSTCCLKTHGFGGVFTMSLKLAVGMTPKSLMRQLHRSPNMRKMIAEINLGYSPRFILLDGLEAFVDGGPMTGKKVPAGVIIAGTDRVAVDAVGIAVLKDLGSNEAIMSKKIFEQEQIQHAAELGIGVSGPEQIEVTAVDAASRTYAEKIRPILARG